MLSINVNNVNWTTIPYPNQIKVHVPREQTGLQESVQGTLDISSNGFVYALPSKRVTWLKFLGLTTYLSFTGAALKCKHIANRIFHKPIDEKEVKDLKHIFKLATISGDAVIGKYGMSMNERVEQFALTEIEYNAFQRFGNDNSRTEMEMDISRSVRLTSGVYVAKCMQPLFHVDQSKHPPGLSENLQILRSQRHALNDELNRRANRNIALDFLSFLGLTEGSFPNLTDNQIRTRIQDLDDSILTKEKVLQSSQRCNKYAAIAILNQQGCLTQSVKEALITETEEVECCGIMCYRQQKICGLLYKIECCATRCWAINCLCCTCCLWPEGRSLSIITT